ncbi:MAG: hypothetical protein AAF307_13720 [Pseudomonadota bacterium]
MIGLVLWCDAEDGKAVFWCEDHGDLAYYDGLEDGLTAPLALVAGDMVEFSETVSGSLRRAHGACLVSQRAYDGIQDTLLANAKRAEAPARHDADNVVEMSAFRRSG